MPSTAPFRVVLECNGVSRKFFTLFQGRDGSLYVHPYRAEGQPWRIPSIDVDVSSGTRLDFNKFEEPDFDLHKISFHPTGYIHLTNKRQERYRDGTRGPSFEEMYSPYMLCALIPCELQNMPIFAGDKKSMVVTLVLPDEIGPFFMTLYLAKGDVEPAEASQGTLITPRYILPLNNGFKLAFELKAVQSIKNGKPANWPPFPFFLLRNAA